MDRGIPVLNKKLAKIEQTSKWEQHREMIENSRPMVDAHKPTSMNYKINSSKREEIKNSRQREIDKNNQLLVNRIMSIQQKPPKAVNRKPLFFLQLFEFVPFNMKLREISLPTYSRRKA
jgi:Hemingway/CFA97